MAVSLHNSFHLSLSPSFPSLPLPFLPAAHVTLSHRKFFPSVADFLFIAILWVSRSFDALIMPLNIMALRFGQVP